jgi:lipopolysaccharide transport system permease protein/teichoic acid transport system permease protein
VRELRSRYLGSYLGFFWAFIQPSITLIVFWFVFQVGFKSVPVEGSPFILWLISGMIPWFFFSESLATATNSIIENSFLVKKIVFRVSILPIVKIFTALIVHIFFIIIIFICFAIFGIYPHIYNIQLIYYLFSLLILLFGLSWLSSALTVFFRDFGQIISMILQIGFWITPLFWSINIMPEKFHALIKINPVFYITEGYRKTFIHKTWFWEEDLSYIIYYWFISILVLFIGVIIFKSLRPHFEEVL